MEFPGLSIDTEVREVVVDERVVELTRLEFDLLAHLAAKTPRHVYSRGQLLFDVWYSPPDWQTSKTVTEHVRRIRHKIESDPDRRGGSERSPVPATGSSPTREPRNRAPWAATSPHLSLVKSTSRDPLGPWLRRNERNLAHV